MQFVFLSFLYITWTALVVLVGFILIGVLLAHLYEGILGGLGLDEYDTSE